MSDPVIERLDALDVEYEIVRCDPALADTAAFCEAYGYALEDSANTIVVAGKADPPVYAACVVLATMRLDVNKVVRKRLGVRRVSFAGPDDTRQLTGMEIGGVTPIGRTVGKWRRRFTEQGPDGLLDEPRPGAPRTIGDERVEAVIVKTLESKPTEATHWSTRSMAAAMGMSQASISRIWRAFGLQPHRAEGFKLSTDPLFVEKVRDVLGLYLDPPERAVVLCVDEKSQIQALARFAPILPMLVGTPERRSHDYVRHGTTSLFAALEFTTGKVIGSLRRRHRASEFRKFLERIDAEVPDGLEIHLILDNYATHKTPVIKRWLLRHPRFHLHFTPTGASWLNLVERWFAELTTKRIKRGAHTSVQGLEHDIRSWIATWNEDPRPYVWVKTADQILGSLARYCARISDSAH